MNYANKNHAALSPLFICVIIIQLFCTTLIAQISVQKRADQLFEQLHYSKAIVEYQRMLDNDYNTSYASTKVADCYFNLRDFESALPHLERISENPDLPKHYYLKYGQALLSTGNSKKAEKWFKVYKKLNPKDQIIENYIRDDKLLPITVNEKEKYEVSISSLNSEFTEFGTYIFNDTLYFSSSRQKNFAGQNFQWNDEPYLDLYYLPISNLNSEPQLISGDVNSKFHESSATIGFDHKKDTVLYFSRNSYFNKKEKLSEDRVNNIKIYLAYNTDGVWKVKKELGLNDEEYSCMHPFMSLDGKRLYFSSNKPGGQGGFDIYYCEILKRGGLSYPKNAGNVVNTEGNEVFPFVDETGKLFFSSDGHTGYGQLDVFGTINNDNGGFVNVHNLGQPLNSSKDDFAYFANKGGLTGYLSSNREGGLGADDIYEFKFTPSLYIEGTIMDEINKKFLKNVVVEVYEFDTDIKVGETLTDSSGYFNMYIDRNQKFRLVAKRVTHEAQTLEFHTLNIPDNQKSVRQDIIFNPILDVKILAGLDKIYFDFNDADITKQASKELDKVVKLMTETYPEMIIKIESHTDPVGSHKYNDDLSQRRAISTYWYLVSHGVPSERIKSYIGYGKRNLVNNCADPSQCSEEELALNRRTEFPILQLANPTD